MKFKRLVAGGLAAAATLSLSVLLPSEASADALDDCPSDRFCAWLDAGYSGALQTDVINADVYVDYGHYGVSSYWNRTNIELCAFKSGGGVRIIVPGEQTALLNDGWNDNLAGVMSRVASDGRVRC
jgi:hypothetical protein